LGLNGVSGGAFLNAGVLTGTTTPSDYVIEWRMNSTSGNVIFTTGSRYEYDTTIQREHPFYDELVSSGTLYPVIRKVLIGGNTYVPTQDGSYRISPDLLTCLPSVVITPITCNSTYGTDPGGVYPFNLNYENTTDSSTNKSRSFSFQLYNDTKYIAVEFDGFEISEQLKIYYCTTNNPNGTLIENWIHGVVYTGTTNLRTYSNSRPSIYTGGTAPYSGLYPINYPVNPRIAYKNYGGLHTLRFVFKLTNFTWANGDYLKFEIIGGVFEPTIENTNWSLRLDCIPESEMTCVFNANSNISKINSTPTMVYYSDPDCYYEVQYNTTSTFVAPDRTLPATPWLHKYISYITRITASSSGYMHSNPIKIRATLKILAYETLLTYNNSYNTCMNMAAGQTITITKDTTSITFTFSDIADFNDAQSDYSQMTGSTEWATWASYSNTDTRYYGYYRIMTRLGPSCGDTTYGMKTWHFFRTAPVVFNSVNKTMTITYVIPTNNLPQASCDDSYSFVQNQTIGKLSETKNYVIPGGSFVTSCRYEGLMSVLYVVTTTEQINPTSARYCLINIEDVFVNGLCDLSTFGFCKGSTTSNTYPTAWELYRFYDRIRFTDPSTHNTRMNTWCLDRLKGLRTDVCSDYGVNVWETVHCHSGTLPSPSPSPSISQSISLSRTPSVTPSPTTIFPSADMIAYWRFEETSGNFLDVLGNCPAVPFANNYPEYHVPGKINYGAHFSGTTSGARISDVNAQTYLNPNGDEYSIQAWVKLNELPSVSGRTCTILRSSLAASPWENIVVRADGSDRFTMRFTGPNDNNYSYTPNNLIQANTWYHLVFVISGIGKRPVIYVNNTPYSGTTTQGGNIWNVTGTTAGYNFGNAYNGTSHAFNGVIDELCLWKKALTPEEVSILYNNGDGLPYDLPPTPSATPTRTPSISFSRTPSVTLITSPTPSTSTPSYYLFDILTQTTFDTNIEACDTLIPTDGTVYLSTPMPIVGNFVYTNSSLTNYFQGDDYWYYIYSGVKYAVQILSDGMILDVYTCQSVTPSVTPTISVSKTPSLSLSPGASRTPSVTPSISFSRTPSRTPSLSISRTPTRTPSTSSIVSYQYGIVTTVTYGTNIGACETSEIPNSNIYLSTSTPLVDNYVYTNNTLTNYYQGDGRWYFIRNGGSYAIQILSSGMINGVLDCNNIPTPTRTPSISISRTPSRTPSISISRTPTRTPSTSSIVSYQYGIVTTVTYGTNIGACETSEIPNSNIYLSTSTPLVDNYVYTNNTLTNYYQGDGRWYFIRNGGSYAIQILSSGMINGVLDCNNIPTPTRTPSISISRTPSRTPSISISRTPTRTPGVSPSRTPTRTPSVAPTYRYTVDMYYCDYPNCSYSLGMAVIENTYQISVGYFFVYNSNTIMEIMNITTSAPDYYTNFQNYLGYDNCNTACQNSQ